jgi:hypothetical protein
MAHPTRLSQPVVEPDFVLERLARLDDMDELIEQPSLPK